MLPKTLTSALAHTLNSPVRSAQRVSGGDINAAARVVLDSGTVVFVKWNGAGPEGMFEREAMSLEAMRESGTTLRIPRPLAWDDAASPGWLALEWLDSGRRAADFDVRLGRGLAEMHRATSERGFGFAVTTYCGTTTQPNTWCADWATFYAEQRMGHQLELARARRGVPRGAERDFQRLVSRLPEILDTGEPPSLIHGDLWSGNVHVCADGHPAIFDPAAYYAHREAELGMMSHLGGFSPRVYEAYHDAWPLPDGWRARLEIYALYHILNHYNLFGGSYGAQAFAMARRWAR